MYFITADIVTCQEPDNLLKVNFHSSSEERENFPFNHSSLSFDADEVKSFISFANKKLPPNYSIHPKLPSLMTRRQVNIRFCLLSAQGIASYNVAALEVE